MQIHGRKSFTIFPPRDLPFLVDRKGYCTFFRRLWRFAHLNLCMLCICPRIAFLTNHCSFVDLRAPDSSRFPDLSKVSARPLSVVLLMTLTLFYKDHAA